MEQIPDAPYIREAERYGMPPYDVPQCPVCGHECNSIFMDYSGNVFGCENCIRERDSYEWRDEETEASRPDWADEKEVHDG